MTVCYIRFHELYGRFVRFGRIVFGKMHSLRISVLVIASLLKLNPSPFYRFIFAPPSFFALWSQRSIAYASPGEWALFVVACLVPCVKCLIAVLSSYCCVSGTGSVAHALTSMHSSIHSFVLPSSYVASHSNHVSLMVLQVSCRRFIRSSLFIVCNFWWSFGIRVAVCWG
jgi:hypothetical protein